MSDDSKTELLGSKHKCDYSCDLEGPCSVCWSVINAAEEVLADLRTLDEYAKNAGAVALTHPYPCHGEWYIDNDVTGEFFKGPTPDAARAKAAARVREQANGAKKCPICDSTDHSPYSCDVGS